MSKIYVLGDLHGCYKGLKQCLERSNFDYETDTLIQLGDVVDGWDEVYECVEELLKIKKLKILKGNHDDWFKHFLTLNTHPVSWLQGGEGTLKSYCDNLGKWFEPKYSGYNTNLKSIDIPKSHIDFFNNQLPYYKDNNNNIFVHGGFDRLYKLDNQPDNEIFWWDRNLWNQALSVKSGIGFEGMSKPSLKIIESCNEIFIGHTPTISWKTDKPINASIIWNLDTGAGFGAGKLTIMNIESKEYFQSDPAKSLYPNYKGRG